MVLRIIVAIAFLFWMVAVSHASWLDAKVLIDGVWGSGEGMFGLLQEDTSDSFPNLDAILSNQEIVVDDITNDRVLVYGPRGDKLKEIYWVVATDSSGEEYYQLPEYGVSNVKRFMPDGGYWTSDGNEANQYNEQNKLLATYHEKPLELGIERTHRALPDKEYLQVIEFEDVKFAIVTTGGIGGIVRDAAGNLYGTESIPGIKTASRKRVHKFDGCSREIAHVDLPEDDIRYEDTGIGDAPTSHVSVIEEYGPPVIGPDGSVYCWRRTSDTYSILKWEWVDDPSDPASGPDAPTNPTVMASLDGLFLTWTASPQDPGCVDTYEIERSSNADGIYSAVGTTNAGVLKYNDTTPLPGETVYYRIRAKSGSDYSDYTSVISGKRP